MTRLSYWSLSRYLQPMNSAGPWLGNFAYMRASPVLAIDPLDYSGCGRPLDKAPECFATLELAHDAPVGGHGHTRRCSASIGQNAKPSISAMDLSNHPSSHVALMHNLPEAFAHCAQGARLGLVPVEIAERQVRFKADRVRDGEMKLILSNTSSATQFARVRLAPVQADRLETKPANSRAFLCAAETSAETPYLSLSWA